MGSGVGVVHRRGQGWGWGWEGSGVGMGDVRDGWGCGVLIMYSAQVPVG